MQKPIALDCLDLFPTLDIDAVNDYINHLNALKQREIVNLSTIITEEFEVSDVISGAICITNNDFIPIVFNFVNKRIISACQTISKFQFSKIITLSVFDLKTVCDTFTIPCFELNKT